MKFQQLSASVDMPRLLRCERGDLEQASLVLSKASTESSFVVVAAGAEMQTKDGALAQMAAKLTCPSYFGHNYDALDECLMDISWVPAVSIQLVIVNAHLLLSARSLVTGHFSSILLLK